MPSSLSVKVVALIYGALGLAALIEGIIILSTKVTVPLSDATVAYGIFGIGLTISGSLGILPIVMGLLVLTLAAGLWFEVEWALWLTIGFNLILLVMTLGAWLILEIVHSLPIIGSLVNFPWYEFGIPVVAFLALSAVLLTKRADFD